jgi:large conductance mechanosensitive channel
MFNEFKAFIARGSVIDLAVGIVIGAAFTSVVNSLVRDILMPPIGLIAGGVDFTELYLNLGSEEFASHAAAVAAGAPTVNYGIFINNLISFLIVSFAVFLLVKAYNRIRMLEKNAPPAPTERDCPFCRMRVPLDAIRCGHCTSEMAAVN